MNTLRRCVPALVLGLMIAFAGAAFAQTVSQASGDKTASCCCSCCGDSCPMMKKDATKNHVTATDKEGCCGCCGDSCDMKKKDAMKNHVMASDKEDGCCGDSCDMKSHTKTTGTTTNMSSEKHDCCADSCDVKDMKEMKPKPSV